MEIGMLQIHADALQSSNTAYHEFLLCYKPNECIVYGFVEGNEDPMFYRGLIENHLPEGWELILIKTGSRDNVFTTFQNMNWTRFPPKRVCFFVDRDLSEFLEEELCSGSNLYVTDNYSIENDIVTFGTLKRVLEEVLGITELNAIEIEKLEEIFEYNDSVFREAMAPVMAQILLWRRTRMKVSLDNIHPKDFFAFIDAKIMLKKECSSPDARVQHVAMCLNNIVSPLHELATSEAEFRKKEGLKKYIRGKYLLWFFVQCALEIHTAIPIFCEKYRSPPKRRVGLGVGNSMPIIAPRIRCPASLEHFIARNYVSYIKEVRTASHVPTGLRNGEDTSFDCTGGACPP